MPQAWTPSLELAAHLIPARKIEAREQRRRLPTGMATLDEMLGGGWVRGALNELCGARGSGRTAVLLASLAKTLLAGSSAALVDLDGALDPHVASRAGLPLDRLLWVRAGAGERQDDERLAHKTLMAAELVLQAGGFALLAVDLGEKRPRVPAAAWVRLARGAASQQTALLVASTQRLFGASPTCVLGLRPLRPRLDRGRRGTEPALLMGLDVSARLEREPRAPVSGLPLAFRHDLSR